ncbi:MAG: hypothetical protein CL897_01245 [Dehalococcoidia bacterium]|nr:hypothetical protein [Dehalococcoidia bacterium]
MSSVDGEEPLRFFDILNMASSVASAHGARAVAPTHLLEALAVLMGEVQLENLGDVVSPLGHGRPQLSVDGAVQELTQRWFKKLGSSPDATLGSVELRDYRAEVEILIKL